MLALMPQWQVIYIASDGLEAVQKALQLQPDLILLDIGLPIMDGVEAARQIRKLAPRSKVLFLSENHSSDIAREAFVQGASGYVVKVDAGRQLLDAVGAVMRGKQFVSDSIAGRNAGSREVAELYLGRDPQQMPSVEQCPLVEASALSAARVCLPHKSR
jgi:DNA-binding NarL/FixJ family response regulator